MIQTEMRDVAKLCNLDIDNNLKSIVNFSLFSLLQVATATAAVKPAASPSKSSGSEVNNLIIHLSFSKASKMRLELSVSTISYISGGKWSSEASRQA